MTFLVKYEGRHPIHAKDKDGKDITLYYKREGEISELPNVGREYCKILCETPKETKVIEKKNKKKVK